MILNYKVVNGTSQTFEEAVKQLIDKGWEPQGGVHVVHGPNGSTYYQAMIQRSNSRF